MQNILEIAIIWVLPLLFAITLHEAAHAYAAYFLGDMTAYLSSRMTLNPIKHIDLIGTIAIPGVLLALGSPFVFGYAKPVPVNFANLSHPRRDGAIVGLAGPLANLFMGLLWALLKLLLLYFEVQNPYWVKIADAGIVINLVLFAFNLFPLPPLDGGRILCFFLPPNLAYQFGKIERFGFFIVLGLVYLGVTHYWMKPVMMLGRYIIYGCLYPLIAFLT